MNIYLLNRVLKNYLLMLFAFFGVDILFRILMDFTVFDWSLLRIFLGLNVICLLLSLLFSFLGRIGSKFFAYIISFLVSVYAFVQVGFFNYLGVYASLNSKDQAGAVIDYAIDFFMSIDLSAYLIFIPFLLLTVYYIFFDRKFVRRVVNDKINIFNNNSVNVLDDFNKTSKRSLMMTRVLSGVGCLVFVSLFYFSLDAKFMENKLQLIDTKTLFKTMEIPDAAMNQFGTSIFALLDVKSYFMPVVKVDDGFVYKKPEQEVTDYSREINDDYWISLLDSETNSNYSSLHSYYLSKEIASKNEYTGKFKDKNLITIMMESVNNIYINEEHFPNFYKLYNEGMSWDNAYSPRNACSTANNELIGMISQFTILNECTANIKKNNTYFNSLFNLMKNDDYSTTSFHNYDQHYYDRKVIHPNFGSDGYYDVNDLEIPYNEVYEEWPSDVELIEKSYDIFTDTEDKFSALLTTVTSHQPYYVNSEYGDKHLELFEDTDYDIDTKRYLSKLKELDLAIGLLMEKLEEDGILDDTVIVLYADHYPYGLKDERIGNYFNKDVSKYNEVDRTPFVIYNSEMPAKKFDEYTSMMNLLPTLANLFDLNYDPRMYAGDDLFSDDYINRAVFANGSWINDKAYYNGQTGRIEYFDNNDTYEENLIIEYNKDIRQRIKMSNLAINTNYFEYLGNKFKENNASIFEGSEVNEETSNSGITE